MKTFNQHLTEGAWTKHAAGLKPGASKKISDTHAVEVSGDGKTVRHVEHRENGFTVLASRANPYYQAESVEDLDEAKLHVPPGHVRISEAEHEKMKAALGPKHVYRGPTGKEGHGHAIHVSVNDEYTTRQHYAHYNHKLPSTWEHYHRESGKRFYTKKKDGGM